MNYHMHTVHRAPRHNNYNDDITLKRCMIYGNSDDDSITVIMTVKVLNRCVSVCYVISFARAVCVGVVCVSSAWIVKVTFS